MRYKPTTIVSSKTKPSSVNYIHVNPIKSFDIHTYKHFWIFYRMKGEILNLKNPTNLEAD